MVLDVLSFIWFQFDESHLSEITEEINQVIGKKTLCYSALHCNQIFVHHRQTLTKNSSFLEAPPFPSLKLSGLDFISFQHSLKEPDSDLLSGLPDFTLHLFLTPITESLDNTNMKEIKGLDERLAGLQQILYNVQAVMQSQADMAQGFQQNQTRAQNIGDPSVLPDLCASHQKQLMMLMKNHSHLRFFPLTRLHFMKCTDLLQLS